MKIQQIYVNLSSQNIDGTLMYPNTFIQTWALIPATRTWILINQTECVKNEN